jgi:hypothetical protein
LHELVRAKGLPPQNVGRSQTNRRKKIERLKIKSAISRNSNKNKQTDNPAEQYGNKEIADFIVRKSAAIFAQRRRKTINPERKRRPAFCPTGRRLLTAQIARSLRSRRPKEEQPRVGLRGRSVFRTRG